MKHKPGCNYRQFDACLKAGHSGAKLVGIGLTLARLGPEMDTFLRNAFTRRVFCSLSAESDSDKGVAVSIPMLLAVTRLSTQRTKASPCAVRTRDVNRTNGRRAIRKVRPASQQRVSPSGLTTFPPAGKSGLSPDKRYTGERLWCVIRRASQSSLNSYPIDIGYGALTEQARMTGSTPNPNKKGYGSVAGITEQGITAHGLYRYKGMSKHRKYGFTVDGKMTYREYIKSEAWELKKLQYRRSGLYTGACKACGSTSGIHLHHRSYQRLGQEYLQDLVELCGPCHMAGHEQGLDNWKMPKLLRKATSRSFGV